MNELLQKFLKELKEEAEKTQVSADEETLINEMPLNELRQHAQKQRKVINRICQKYLNLKRDHEAELRKTNTHLESQTTIQSNKNRKLLTFVEQTQQWAQNTVAQLQAENQELKQSMKKNFRQVNN